MAGRGRGGFGGGARGGLKGATWEHDPTVTIDSKPSDLFPRHPNIKTPHPPSDREIRQVRNYKVVKDRIHRGPLYTQSSRRNDIAAAVKVFSEAQFNSQFASDSKADLDPFYGVETYSQRMAGKSNSMPKLTGRPFDLKLFPEELWETLEGKSGDRIRAAKTDMILDKQRRRELGQKDPLDDATAEARMKNIMERIHKLDDDDVAADDEEQADEPDQDSDFDDDSMGGDYDGEQYFDNGEDDMDGGDEGGGGEEY